MSGTVHYVVEGAVATATIDAPEMRNALGAPGVRDALDASVARFEADPELRVMVLTGANGVFSAGGNLKALRDIRGEEQMRARIRGGDKGALKTMLTSPKLYVAAVEGPAFGAALGLVAACDYVVAAEGARFCAAQIRVGASPDGGLFWALPLRVGRSLAKRILLTGDEIDQQTALAAGLADEGAADGAALATAQKRAARLARGAPLAQATVKRFFAEGPDTMPEVMEWERETAIANFLTEDFVEGASAFLEKRHATFRGR